MRVWHQHCCTYCITRWCVMFYTVLDVAHWSSTYPNLCSVVCVFSPDVCVFWDSGVVRSVLGTTWRRSSRSTWTGSRGSGPCSRHHRCGTRPPCRPACTPPCWRAQSEQSDAAERRKIALHATRGPHVSFKTWSSFYYIATWLQISCLEWVGSAVGIAAPVSAIESKCVYIIGIILILCSLLSQRQNIDEGIETSLFILNEGCHLFDIKTVFTKATPSQRSPAVHFPIFISRNEKSLNKVELWCHQLHRKIFASLLVFLALLPRYLTPSFQY